MEVNMELNENILLAKKYLVDSIYRSVNIEGIAMTYPDTQTVVEGMSVAGYKVSEIDAVNDLKHGWEWLLSHIDNNINIETLKTLNRILGKYTVSNAGSIRGPFDADIRIGGTDWTPDIPPRDEIIQQNINACMYSNDTLENALELFCLCARGQYFLDGNKRTATLFTNMYMIKNGCGIFSIPVKLKNDFYKLLIKFYETNDPSALKIFFRENCITTKKEKSLGDKLVFLRENNNFTREKSAKTLNLPADTLYAYERDELVPDKSTLKKLCDLYDIDMDRL